MDEILRTWSFKRNLLSSTFTSWWYCFCVWCLVCRQIFKVLLSKNLLLSRWRGIWNLFGYEKSSRFRISSPDAETGVFDVFVDVSSWVKARHISSTKSIFLTEFLARWLVESFVFDKSTDHVKMTSWWHNLVFFLSREIFSETSRKGRLNCQCYCFLE